MPQEDNKSARGDFSFKVNGEELHTEFEKLVAIDILRLAGEKGIIPRNPEDYALQGDKGTYQADDWVNLNEDNVFIALPTTPTPVA